MTNEEGVMPEPAEETQDAEGQIQDLDKIDNVAQLRDHAKELKADVDKYKSSYEFVNQYGEDVLKDASNVYSLYTAEEFNPDEFSTTLSELSPTRYQEIADKLSKERAEEIFNEKISSLFGELPNEDEIKAFREFKVKGVLGDGDDIPESLKFNSDGTPKSEEELEFLREIQREKRELQASRQKQEDALKAQREQERQRELETKVMEFNNERLKVIDDELNTYIPISESDTSEVRNQKQLLRQFFKNGISGVFLENPEMAKAHEQAVKHIASGEPMLARKYVASIDESLLKLTRNEGITNLLKTLVGDSPEEPRKEFSNPSDSSTPKQEGRFDVDAKIRELISQGKISV